MQSVTCTRAHVEHVQILWWQVYCILQKLAVADDLVVVMQR